MSYDYKHPIARFGNQGSHVDDLKNEAFCEESKLVGNKVYRMGVCCDCGEEYGFVRLDFAGVEIPQYCKCDREGSSEYEAKRKLEQEAINLRKQVELVKQHSGFLLEHQDMTFERFTPSCSSAVEAFEKSKLYVEKFTDFRTAGKGLLFTGNTGSGKTHLCAAIGNALLEQGISVKIIHCSLLFRKIRDTYRGFDTSIEQIMLPYECCTLLILDELTADKTTMMENEQLETLIDTRLGNRRPTIITTNSTPLQLMAENSLIDKRIVSRIFDKRKYALINISAPDFRRGWMDG